MYTINKQSGKVAYGIKHLICDTDEDILILPTNYSIGSTAFSIKSSTHYMLNNKKKWTKYLTNNGDGGVCPGPDEDVIYDGGLI